MAARVWEKFLTESDKAHVAVFGKKQVGFGDKPALLLIDLYRAVFGDQPEPLLESIKTWPSSHGLAGWKALPHIQTLLNAAREAGIPIVHVTGISEYEQGVVGWNDRIHPSRRGRQRTPEQEDRQRRAYDIVDEVAPLNGEVVLRKAAPSAFWGTPLAAQLRYMGIDTVITCGESTSGCVRASVVEGATHTYRMIVAEECVFDRHEATHALNLFDMDQKYGDVTPLGDILEYLGAWAAERRASP
jgi:nicotinamidase-related amidase